MVCNLGPAEVVQVEHGIRPDCHRHRHLTRREANQHVAAGVARWLGTNQRALSATITATEVIRAATGSGYDRAVITGGAEWRPRPSGPGGLQAATVVQMENGLGRRKRQ